MIRIATLVSHYIIDDDCDDGDDDDDENEDDVAAAAAAADDDDDDDDKTYTCIWHIAHLMHSGKQWKHLGQHHTV